MRSAQKSPSESKAVLEITGSSCGEFQAILDGFSMELGKLGEVAKEGKDFLARHRAISLLGSIPYFRDGSLDIVKLRKNLHFLRNFREQETDTELKKAIKYEIRNLKREL